MASSLTFDSIRFKRADVERQIRDAEQAIGRLRQIIADLDAAERVMRMMGPEPDDLFGQHAAPRAMPVAATIVAMPLPTKMAGGGLGVSVRNPFRHGTNKAFIWEVLDRAGDPWLNANQIQELASKLKGEEIPMSSISPMLSEMKGEYLERDNLRVALKSRLNENGAGDEPTSPAPETALDAQGKEATEC